MAQKSKSLTKEKLVEESLALAASRGWGMLSLNDIAQVLEISLADLHELAEDKDDILVMLGRIIDRRTLENVGELSADVSSRDQLFDVMMERFDVLNEYRAGLIAIMDSFKCDPKQAIISMPHICKSMTWMLEAAGIETTGIRGALKVTGLVGVYLNVLRAWKDDESADMAKVMAALDKDLGRAESLINMVGF